MKKGRTKFMEVMDLFLPSTNTLVNDYLTNKIDTYNYFDYDIHSPLVYEVRKKDVLSRTFPRERLVQHLLNFNRKYNSHEQTIKNIYKLSDPNSVVVVGGQQAGVLTGPLYTIHKIISIIKLARQQEELLNIPVIPVFWIAGEDHDFAEINHLFVNDGNHIRKKILPQQQHSKSMVTSIEIDKKLCEDWLKEVFETYGETDNTNEIIQLLLLQLEKSTTYVDFFMQIISTLFGDTGIVMVDSGSVELREIESDFLVEIIEKNRGIHDAVLHQQEILQSANYSKSIEMNENSANLFYQVGSDRVLLEYYPEHDIFRGKNNECILCSEELIEFAKTHPGSISNNVITRPLMQELLFPTLAFISGPGEVSYWAELKQAFTVMGMKMPPVVPRLMMTIIERSIESNIVDIGLSISDAINGKVMSAKNAWIAKHTSNFDDVMIQAKQEAENIHKRVRNAALEIDKSLLDLLLKNAENFQTQLEFVNHTVSKRVLLQNEVEMKKFERIEYSLKPLGSPQERIWNIFYYLNKYGLDFTSNLVELPFEFNGKHKIIKV
ncbi:bacillithiol biosynthesis cysteine-adding enzyme BshC [Fredinandcohnia quinoae]|uniref:Putative cysteine ligase BshC n=1 Tax=Fredinandcohnia quinoae TaxID=2918902 RepID=A0AAW5DXW3_9BACI|nr:bacillithiol biosynthesis cysteine-adding enzyme BshC [Fredinandcohnia sp. SECRCQ15]MCH1623885.1 bacillithiol biosynthesis cysteine-adding enzyme BshC [Fredinandcohnia sp. SECRCQ15]